MLTGYINYLDTQIKRFITSAKLDDLAFLGVHDGLSYDDKSDIKITVIRLTGSIDSGIVRIPYQIICEVNTEYLDQMRDCLDSFAYEMNEVVTTIDGTQYKQLYSTSYTLNNFQQNGLVDRTTIAINANLVSFGPVDITSFKIKCGNDVDDTVELQDIAINYSTTPSSAGARINDNGILKRINREVALSYAITFVPKNTTIQKDIAKQAIFGTNINKEYDLIISTCGVTNTIKCLLVNANITKQKNGVMAVSATFMVGDL